MNTKLPRLIRVSLTEMRTSSLLLALIVVTLASCDSLDVGAEEDHSDMITAAKVYYKEAIDTPPLESSSYDLFRLAQRRPPDWSTARVVRRYDGGQVVAALLNGTALRPVNDSLSSLGMIVFEMRHGNRVHSAQILEFAMRTPAQPSAFPRYLMDYWREEFQEALVSVAEFSIHYTPQRGRVFLASEKPREARIEVRNSEAGKGHGTRATCYYIIICYEDPETGHTLWCDGNTLRLHYCIGEVEDDDEDGGGGSGGYDDEEDDCDCSNENQCELEEEYESVNGSWPCSKFYTVPGYLYVGADGTHGGEHEGYGYISSSLENGLTSVESAFEANLSINSAYRCPVGNSNIPGSGSNSFHIHGQAADFQTTTPQWSAAVRDSIAQWAERKGGAAEVRTYGGHIHLAW